MTIIYYAFMLAFSDAFITPSVLFNRPTKLFHSNRRFAKPNLLEEAATLKAQAKQIRLEAQQMETTLTLKKIASLEIKLNNSTWLEKHPNKTTNLLKQLTDLQNKRDGNPPTSYIDTFVSNNDTLVELVSKHSPSAVTKPSKVVLSHEDAEIRRLKEFPIAGFEQEDLDLYLPVAYEIEATMGNATMDQKLVAFRERPDLQEHFQAKIQKLLVKPMEDMKKIDDLKKKYLNSRSKIEKESIKREMERLEQTYENESPFFETENNIRRTKPMSDEEMESRLLTMGELPELLQDLFKLRNGVQVSESLKLAILMEHYEQQLHLLNQMRFLEGRSDESRNEAIIGFDALPEDIRDHFCKSIGINGDSNGTVAIAKLERGRVSGQVGPINRVVAQASLPDIPEYNDIEFVDRSRYAEEFIPAFTRMEELRPTGDQIAAFTNEVLTKKSFTLTSKPERVLGGYYLRGLNKFEDKDGKHPAGDRLVTALSENLRKSSLSGKIQFFYLPDPTPQSDEDIERGNDAEPVLLVTTIDPKFYKLAQPLNKLFVSAAGLLSTIVLALGACELNGFNYNQFNVQLEAYKAGTGDLDVSWLTDMAAPIAVSLLVIQLVHEISHRLVAWKDKFDIGLPNLVPSLQLGLTGAITPLKSPPPNLRSLFDFSMAGPLSGIALSLVLLIHGLGETVHLDLAQQATLPALPIGLLRTSALGGGLVEMFLGNGVLDLPDESVLPLSPLAIAGYLGLISNAIALLPLGHTDGGRIAITMFGRRGSFLIKSFTTLMLCAIGLFDLDSQAIFVVYVLFVTIWQRELESPIRNEVDELDFGRGCIGILVALLVALTLLPHM